MIKRIEIGKGNGLPSIRWNDVKSIITYMTHLHAYIFLRMYNNIINILRNIRSRYRSSFNRSRITLREKRNDAGKIARCSGASYVLSDVSRIFHLFEVHAIINLSHYFTTKSTFRVRILFLLILRHRINVL
ncbi:hypothetical protein PUN28_000780 [Cardiocondyla obscurior]|uniref:Uncharacterized protein n=1 Tax=Cardiocondyla obscurior TaxID=286306 RepID=A0AAW2H104_9HYME